MKGIVPARVPVHRTRKEELHSYREELQDQFLGRISPSQKENIRSRFVAPDLETFYSQRVRL
ncbi:hypothetical protein ACSAZL_06380 [Methanosarcina sp. T3]|uniref:hypothetical protein n=1 Tax=Methanosarcina sp. T3 TaxID=3439062 RepID=UPI003F859716